MVHSGNKMSPPLLILGASTRAAAFSALATGLAPQCADQFADADLAGRCPVTAIDEYPQGFEAMARTARAAPWMYTGALENQPALVERISAGRLLLGNGPDVLRRVRDPFAVQEALARSGLAVPEVRRSSEGLPRDGTWLRKARRSSGGYGVEQWFATARPEIAQDDSHYFQQRIAGTAGAAIYLAAAGHARLLGATEQILTSRPGEDGAFRYSGSIGPWRLDGRQAESLARIGRCLAAEFALTGLFGVDYLDDGEGIWPVEVNPRYTASIEILERALRFSAVGGHVAACREGKLPDVRPAVGDLWHGKRIIFAPANVEITAAFTLDALAQNDDLSCPATADIPRAGTRIKAGRPVMTVFAQTPTRAETLAQLECARRGWEQRLVTAWAAAR